MLSKYIIVGISVLLIMVSGFSKYLYDKLEVTKLELALSKTNENNLIKAVGEQNATIVKYELDLKTKTEEYDSLSSLPPEVRYETVYKKVPSIKVKSNECKDIKKLIDDIRNAGY